MTEELESEVFVLSPELGEFIRWGVRDWCW